LIFLLLIPAPHSLHFILNAISQSADVTKFTPNFILLTPAVSIKLISKISLSPTAGVTKLCTPHFILLTPAVFIQICLTAGLTKRGRERERDLTPAVFITLSPKFVKVPQRV
jgi:choline-glycine betaine transporter